VYKDKDKGYKETRFEIENTSNYKAKVYQETNCLVEENGTRHSLSTINVAIPDHKLGYPIAAVFDNPYI
jgi:hypothetical protein